MLQSAILYHIVDDGDTLNTISILHTHTTISRYVCIKAMLKEYYKYCLFVSLLCILLHPPSSTKLIKIDTSNYMKVFILWNYV